MHLVYCDNITCALLNIYFLIYRYHKTSNGNILNRDEKWPRVERKKVENKKSERQFLFENQKAIPMMFIVNPFSCEPEIFGIYTPRTNVSKRESISNKYQASRVLVKIESETPWQLLRGMNDWTACGLRTMDHFYFIFKMLLCDLVISLLFF